MGGGHEGAVQGTERHLPRLERQTFRATSAQRQERGQKILQSVPPPHLLHTVQRDEKAAHSEPEILSQRRTMGVEHTARKALRLARQAYIRLAVGRERFCLPRTGTQVRLHSQGQRGTHAPPESGRRLPEHHRHSRSERRRHTDNAQRGDAGHLRDRTEERAYKAEWRVGPRNTHGGCNGRCKSHCEPEARRRRSVRGDGELYVRSELARLNLQDHRPCSSLRGQAHHPQRLGAPPQ